MQVFWKSGELLQGSSYFVRKQTFSIQYEIAKHFVKKLFQNQQMTLAFKGLSIQTCFCGK